MNYLPGRFIRFSSIPAWLTLLSMIMLSQAASAQQYKKIPRMGTSQAVCPAGVQTTAALQQYFVENADGIRSILADSGWAGNADDLFTAVANGEITETAYPVGTRMAWMGARIDGKYTAVDYREWAGKKSFEAYRIDVSSNCQVYEIALPKICCNMSLISVTPDTSSECVAPVAAVAPAAAEEPAAPAAPTAAKALGWVPFLGLFAGSEKRPRFEPVWAKDVEDSSGIAGIRAGLMKELSAKTSIFGQLSYYDRSGINEFNIYPEDNLAVDIGIDRKLSEHTFIGGGIGIWNVDDSDYSDGSLFGHVGGDIGKSKFQWFLEGRIFDSDSDMLDGISDNKMFSGGVRYLIK